MSSNTNSTRKYIFIGDSYGTAIAGGTGWIGEIVSLAGLAEGDYYSSSVHGAGFVNEIKDDDAPETNTFIKQIERVGTNIVDKSSITDIIVCGGWNDTTTTYDDNYVSPAEERQAIESFIDHCNTNYPNATVRIGYIGWARMVSESYDRRLYYTLSSFVELFQTIDRDYVYLNGVENILPSSLSYIFKGDNTQYAGDYIHSNAVGTKFLAKKIWEAIQTGCCDTTVGTKSIPLTYASGITPNRGLEIYTTVKNGMRQIYFSNFDLVFSSPQTVKGNGLEYISIGTLNTNILGSFNGSEHVCKIFSTDSYVISNGTALAGTLTLWVEGHGKVRMGFKPTMTVNDSISVTKAYMCSPHVVTVPLIQT